LIDDAASESAALRVMPFLMSTAAIAACSDQSSLLHASRNYAS